MNWNPHPKYTGVAVMPPPQSLDTLKWAGANRVKGKNDIPAASGLIVTKFQIDTR